MTGEAAGRAVAASLLLAASDVVAGLDVAIEGVGWATVELLRAAAQLTAALGDQLAGPFEAAPADAVLGAHARVARLAAGPRLVLLEPNTEGRLAAFLARYGEGLAAVYVSDPGRPSPGVASGDRPTQLLRTGPLGESRHAAGDRHGPFLIQVWPDQK